MLRHLLLLLTLTTPLVAQENLFRQVPKPTHKNDKSEVQVDAMFSMAAPTGYLPVRVTVVNQRASDIELSFAASSTSGGYDDDSRVNSDFEIATTKESSSTHDLLVPLTTVLENARHGNGSLVNLSMSGSFGRNSGGVSSNYADGVAAVMMSEKLHTPNASILDSELGKSISGYGSPSFAGRFDPAIMPEDWRAYSGYDAFLMTDEDWALVAPGARNAMLQWCRLGGKLAIYKINGSTSFKTLGIEGEATGDQMDFGYGQVELQPIPNTLSLDPASTVASYRGKLSAPLLNRSIRDDYSGRWPLHSSFGRQKFAYGIFVVVLIAFGILVGPVNLFVFAKSGIRHKLFITTPIISIGTCAVLILLILLKDGIGGRGERIALIEVRPDAGENNAYVMQEQVSRTGVLLGASFDIGESAAITPVPISPSPWTRLPSGSGGGGMRYTMNQRDGKLAVTGDWFQSRSEQGQLVRAVVPTRGRIELKSQGGTPVLLSTYEFPVASLYYADASGGYWVARDLKPGTNTSCTSISQTEYNQAITDQVARLGNRHGQLLAKAAKRSDHYVAIAAEAPAIETFDSINWSATSSIITGPVLR
ncbi:MAG: hypothetical protein AAGI48_16085 [Verrucomicrobiota bacterium]